MSFNRLSNLLSLVAGTAAMLVSLTAVAKQEVRATAPTEQPARVQLLADVVVNGAQQPAPAPAQPVVVQPQAQQAPVVEPTRRTTVVEHEDRNYMGTIAWSAIAGGAAGALVGAAIYYLGDSRTHGERIGYWAAGGVLVGAGVGLTQIVVEESRVDRATALQQDPAPTLRLALYRAAF